MKDFIVLTKQLKLSGSSNQLNYDFLQMDYLLQETFRTEPMKWDMFKKYEIDRSTVKVEVINGALFAIMIAFKKEGN